MSNDSVNDFLFGSGARAFSFEKLGDSVDGTVISADVQQQTDIDSNEPKFFSDGKPMNQLVIRLQTDIRDPEIDDDDGIRTVYAKGGRYNVAEGEGLAMRDAIAKAVRDGGGKALEEGDRLVIAHTGVAERKTRGHNPAKLYTAGWRKGKAAVSGSDLFGDEGA